MESSLTELIKRADALYAKRIEIRNVRLSVDLLKEIAPGSYDAAWRLSRSLFFLGQEANDKSGVRTHHANGMRAGARAVKLQPASVEGHFWLGVNLALLAQSKNQFFALGLVWLAKRSLRRAIRIDSAYHGAGPLRVLARIQHKLPRVLGGGKKRARTNFERALQLAPENTVTRIYYAELLLEMEDVHEARKHLEAILHARPDPAWDFESRRDRKIAQEQLTMMENI